MYSKEFLANFFAFSEFGHLMYVSTFPVLVFIDNRAVTRFLQTKIIPPAPWNACDYVLQYNSVIAHVAGAMNTAADFLSRTEINPTENLKMNLRNEIQTKAIEVNIQPSGIAEKGKYYNEIGQISHYQILLPKQLLEEFLQALHGHNAKHPGITKMIQEAQQKYYYRCLAKHIKNWVQNCQMCIQNKRINNDLLKTELLNYPEWDIGPEDVLQMDILPNLPPSVGFDNIITAIDVFSRYLFAYPTTRITAPTVARVIMDILCKHTYLPTTIIPDTDTQFNSQITRDVAAVLGVQLKHASTKHAQAIGMLERTHASVKTHLKAATGEFRNNWHKLLPLAVLNHNTTYLASLACEPTRVFHGRIPHNILDYKLGYTPNPRYTPQTYIAEEIQRRMEILNNQTKKNIMQSYLNNKAYSDRKAKALLTTTTDYCYILNTKADTQATKIPFREFRWIGPYKVEKVLTNNNYIVRRLETSKT